MTKRHALTVATWNLGNARKHEARGIIEQEKPAAFGLQEASDQDELIDAACAGGLMLPIRPDVEVGQAATPLLYDPKQLRAIRMFAELMVPGQPVGKGTGPDHMKPKWLIGAFFVHLASGRHVALASTHRVADNSHGPREQVATEHARKVAEFFKGYRSISAVLGDWNSRASDNTLAPLREHGWYSDQLTFREIPTHKHWAPDAVWYRTRWQNGALDDRIRYVGHHTIDGTESDHRPLVVDFELTARPR